MRSARSLFKRLTLAVLCSSCALVGCSSASDHPAPPVATPVTVSINDPSEGAQIPLASLVNGSDYELAYGADNFTLAAPGECAGKATPCGHGRVWVDDMACNDMDKQLLYNSEGVSPISVGFDYCPALIGAHQILLKLQNDDGSPFVDPATGQLVSAQVQVTVTGATPGSGGSGGSGGRGDGGQAGAR